MVELQPVLDHLLCVCSALVKLLNKSIDGTADDEEEGVTPDTAIRSGLELLKVRGPFYLSLGATAISTHSVAETTCAFRLLA